MDNIGKPSALLFSMPWAMLEEPSLGLGILKTQLESKGVPCRVRHANLFLLDYIKAFTYSTVASYHSLNDFLFTYVIENSISKQQYKILLEVSTNILKSTAHPDWENKHPEELADILLKIRNALIPRFLDDCLKFVKTIRPTFVGFTCMYDQTIASVALAKLIKTNNPDILIVFGGYALKGATGYAVLRSFPWVDVVVEGEGEPIIERLAESSINKSLLSDIPGIQYRDSSDNPIKRTKPSSGYFQIDNSPLPRFSDYEADLRELALENHVEVTWDTIPVEGSRGCWWGQSNHCIFCGIDEESLKYRYKDPFIIQQSLKYLYSRHGINRFRFSDYIFPLTYYKTLLPLLADSYDRYELICEIKGNMKFSDLQLFRDAGFIRLQPGIESFSTSVLKKIRKGVSAIQNINLLVQGYKLGIEIHYNYLFGFPTDNIQEYKEQLLVIPLLYHLIPPISRTAVFTTRFSPMHQESEQFGIISKARHDPRYQLMLSRNAQNEYDFDLDDYCYFFDKAYNNSEELEYLYVLLQFQIESWKEIQRTREVRLSYEIKESSILFEDTRFSEQPLVKSYGEFHVKVYTACSESIRSQEWLKENIDISSENKLEQVCKDLIEARVLFNEGDRFLGLAVPSSVYSEKSALDRASSWVSPFV